MSKDVKFLGDIKAINSNGEEYSINKRFQTVESSLSGEVSRAQTIEAGLQGQITANTEAIEKLTNGVSAEEIDSVVDLINYVNNHGSEVEGIQENIKELQEGINDKADKATTLDGYGITDTYNQTEIDNKLKDTKNYTDTQIQKIGESGFIPVQSNWEAEETTETGDINYAYIQNKPMLGSVASRNVVPVSEGGTGTTTTGGVLGMLGLSSGLTSSGEFTSVSTMEGLDAGVYLVKYEFELKRFITGIAYIDPVNSDTGEDREERLYCICTFISPLTSGGLPYDDGTNIYHLFYSTYYNSFILERRPTAGGNNTLLWDVNVEIRRII